MESEEAKHRRTGHGAYPVEKLRKERALGNNHFTMITASIGTGVIVWDYLQTEVESRKGQLGQVRPYSTACNL